MNFSLQAQYLAKLECHFLWQAQHFVKFWEIAGAPNVVLFHTKCVSKMGRVRSPKRRVRDDDFIFAQIIGLRFSWQAQYLVRFEGDFACSAHCK